MRFSGDAADREGVAEISALIRDQIVAMARQSARRLPLPSHRDRVVLPATPHMRPESVTP